MTTYVLVHGLYHGAWCWEQVVPLLEERGHRAIALDLPGHGADGAPLAAQTLESYVARVARAIDNEEETVVLVGHSMGGIVVTQAAETRAHRVRALVYVSAFLPCDGESMFDLAKRDAESTLLRSIVVDPTTGLHWVTKAAGQEAFWHDCPESDVAKAQRRIVSEPIAPCLTPVRTTPSGFGSVPRTYVECSSDRAIGPSLQRRMREALPCVRTVVMKTGHSPFFVAPAELSAHLLAV